MFDRTFWPSGWWISPATLKPGTVNTSRQAEETRGGSIVDSWFRLREAGLGSPSDPWAPVMSHARFSPATHFQTTGGKRHACTQRAERSSCSVSVSQHTGLSAHVVGTRSIELLLFLFFVDFSVTLSFIDPPACSLCVCCAQSLLIWSSVGQHGSWEARQLASWLINEKQRGEELHWLTCTFKMCF